MYIKYLYVIGPPELQRSESQRTCDAYSFELGVARAAGTKDLA